ncbi:MAG: DsbA family protein, partial [Anaerolinea sp.]|nr:DsbA family protein [Anaerolinea sp.]
MRRLIPVLVVLLSLLPAAAFAQTGPDEDAPAPSIGLLGLIGFTPADFGLSAAEPLSPALQSLRDAAADEVALLASLPQSRTPDGAFVLGDPDAPITIIEFADWACPHCQNYHGTISALIRDQVTSGQAAFEFRILPTAGQDLTILNGALAVCLEEQVPGAFWSAYVYLYHLARTRQYADALTILPQLMGADVDTALACAASAGLEQIRTDVGY